MIGSILEELPDDYCVFHDVHCDGVNGNLDHVVIGPTGMFAVETKNWTGTVTVTMEVGAKNKKLLLNETTYESVGELRGRAWTLKGKLDENLAADPKRFVQAVMVFPNSYLDLSAGEPDQVDLRKSEQLLDYLQYPGASGDGFINVKTGDVVTDINVKTGDVVTDIIDNERFAEKIGS